MLIYLSVYLSINLQGFFKHLRQTTVLIYIYTHTYTHTYIYIYIHTHTHIYIYFLFILFQFHLVLLHLVNIPLCQVTVETVGGGDRVRALWRGHIWQRAERSLIKSIFSSCRENESSSSTTEEADIKPTATQIQPETRMFCCWETSLGYRDARIHWTCEYKVCASMRFLTALRRWYEGKITLTLSPSAGCSLLHDDRVKYPSHS